METIKILLAGEGGQGIQTIAKIISEAAMMAKKHVAYIPSFGVEQRGTPSIGFITVSDQEIYYPRFDVADIIIILQERAIPAVAQYISPNTTVIIDSSTVDIGALPMTSAKVFATPATRYATEKFTPRAFNIIITGKLGAMIKLSKQVVWTLIEKNLGKKFKDEKIRKANEDAFLFGYDLVLETKDFSKPTFQPSTKRILYKGHGKTGEVIPARCKGCGICIEKCPVKAMSFSKTLGVFATPVPDIDLEKCIACGNCSRFCPDAAVKIEKDIKS